MSDVEDYYYLVEPEEMERLEALDDRVKQLEEALQYAVDNFGDYLGDYKRLCEMVEKLGLRVPE